MNPLIPILQEVMMALQDHITTEARRCGVSEETLCPCKTDTLRKAQNAIDEEKKK